MLKPLFQQFADFSYKIIDVGDFICFRFSPMAKLKLVDDHQAKQAHLKFDIINEIVRTE